MHASAITTPRNRRENPTRAFNMECSRAGRAIEATAVSFLFLRGMDTRAKLFGENHLCPDDDHPLRGGKPSGGEPPVFARAIELKLPPDEFVRARFDIHPSPALKTDHRRPWDHHALLGLPGELEEGSHDPAWPEAMPSAVKPKQECLPLELHIDLWS